MIRGVRQSFMGGMEGEGAIPVSSAGSSLYTSSEFLELRREVERQSLLIQTLARLLKAKGVVAEQELNEWLEYVDGLDGRIDGKLVARRRPRDCPRCRRKNPSSALKCIYCDAHLPHRFLDEPEGS